MAAGDIINTNGLQVIEVTVKSGEDIELGEFIVNDGNGYLAATAALAALNVPLVALEAHDYSEVSVHTIRALVHGVVEAQHLANSGAVAVGNKLTISGTAGECAVFAKGAVSAANTFATATDQAALDGNLAAFGFCYVAALTADTTVQVIL
jgi:hypothetical protein